MTKHRAVELLSDTLRALGEPTSKLFLLELHRLPIDHILRRLEVRQAQLRDEVIVASERNHKQKAEAIPNGCRGIVFSGTPYPTGRWVRSHIANEDFAGR